MHAVHAAHAAGGHSLYRAPSVDDSLIPDSRATLYQVLGNTFGMLVLQDFEAMTPNLLARTIETVEGGGIIVFLLSSLDSLSKLYTLAMDCHARFRTESHQQVKNENKKDTRIARRQSTRSSTFLFHWTSPSHFSLCINPNPSLPFRRWCRASTSASCSAWPTAAAVC